MNPINPIEPEGGGKALLLWVLGALAVLWLLHYGMQMFGGKSPVFYVVLAVGAVLAFHNFSRNMRQGGRGPREPELVPADGLMPARPARSTEAEKAEALEALKDESRFITRPAKAALLPSGLPAGVRELFKIYSYAGVTDEEADVYLDSGELGSSRQVGGGLRIGMSYGEELVVFPGDETVYEVHIGTPQAPANRLEVESDCVAYADIWQWVLMRD